MQTDRAVIWSIYVFGSLKKKKKMSLRNLVRHKFILKLQLLSFCLHFVEYFRKSGVR